MQNETATEGIREGMGGGGQRLMVGWRKRRKTRLDFARSRGRQTKLPEKLLPYPAKHGTFGTTSIILVDEAKETSPYGQETDRNRSSV